MARHVVASAMTEKLVGLYDIRRIDHVEIEEIMYSRRKRKSKHREIVMLNAFLEE